MPPVIGLWARREGNFLAPFQELEKRRYCMEKNSKSIAEKSHRESVADSSFVISNYDLSDRLLMGKTKDAMHA